MSTKLYTEPEPFVDPPPPASYKAGLSILGSGSRQAHSRREPEYVFYKMPHQKASRVLAPKSPGYDWFFWRPGLLPPQPVAADVAWVAMHYLRVFSNTDYARVFAFEGTTLVHRLTVFPRWMRYPFMEADDLQIGNVWTHDLHRRRGLATAAIQKVVIAFAAPGRSFWYVTTDKNHASRSAAEHAGFEHFAWGERRKRLGIRLLGSFEINQVVPRPIIDDVKPAIDAQGALTLADRPVAIDVAGRAVS